MRRQLGVAPTRTTDAATKAWTNSGTSETITHVSVWTAATGGSVLWTAALGSSRAWVSGDTFVLTALGISLTPLAS